MEDFVKLIEEINAKIDKLMQVVQPPASDKKDIYKALSAAQLAYKPVAFSAQNSYYQNKYATLSDLQDASREALCENGLSVHQELFQDEVGHNFLRTVLAHVSGQTLSTTVRIAPTENNVHMIGSYLASMRRMSYATLIGLLVHDADDDDGYTCMASRVEMAAKGTKPSFTSKDTKVKEFDTISKSELESLEKSMGAYYDLGEEIINAFQIPSLADLPKSKYEFVLGQMRKNVARRDGLL